MKNYWGLALSLSLLFHSAILIGIPQSLKNIFSKKEKVVKTEVAKEIRISPQRIEKIDKKPTAIPNESKPLPYVENIMSKLIESSNLSSLQKPQIFEKTVKEIIFKEIAEKADATLKENPAYMDYYRLIRERIRNSAYHNYNSQKKGEVLLSFLIGKDGSLKGVDFDPQSVKNSNLRKIALRSVRESAPFPEFPEELQQYTRLQFNISIYFKNN
ncbi:MAG: hypothetical protein HQ570_00515 [Candidatus Omnitrophica bacterium]|nr:hypothetical protein [Candidatus Omnitrophota bacterium]